MYLAFIAGGKFSNLIKWNPKNVDVQYKSSVMQLVCFLLWSGILISFIVEVLVLGAPPAISMAIRSEYFLSLWGSIVILQSVFAGLLFYDRYNQNVVGKLFWVYALTIIIIDGLLD
mgnify:FL=1